MFGRALARALSIVLASTPIACRSDSPAESPAPGAKRPVAPQVRAAKAPAVWVVSAAALRRHRSLAPRPDATPEGAIVDGLRISYPDGAVATEVAEPALVGGTRIPAHAGGGYLFWSGSATYHARSLLAGLRPLAAVPATIRRVSFGSKLALLHFNNGSRHAIELPSGRPLAMPLPGLIDVASAGASAQLAVVEPDRLLIATGSGRLEPASTPIAVEAIHPGDGEVWLQDVSGSAYRLGADGSFGGYDRMPKRPPTNQLVDDPRWPLTDETPLERAIRRGVPIGDRLALVDAGGAMAWVNLATGELAEIGRRILPDRSTCRLFPLERDVVATCSSQTGSSYFASGLAGPEPRIERSFATSGVFHYAGAGTLLFAGPCSTRPDEAGTLCLRGADAHWRSLKPPGVGGDGGAASFSVQRWLPKRDGSVVGVVEGPKPGLLELPSGSFSPFTAKGHESISRLARPSPREAVLDDATLTESGEIALIVDDGSVSIRRDGSVEKSPQHLSQLVQVGPRAIGREASGKLWQTDDWGRSWNAVAGPPSQEPRVRATPRRCSYAGCDFESWYRIGFPLEAEAPRGFTTALPAPRRATGAVPRLECTPTAPARSAIVAQPEGSDASDPKLDLGARRVPAGRQAQRVPFVFADTGPKVALFGTDDGNGLPRLLSARLTEPLSLKPAVRSARPPATLVLPTLFNTGEGTALPVVSGSNGDGWVVLLDGGGSTQLALWMRADRAPRVTSLAEGSLVLDTALQTRGDDLLMLTGDGDSCASRVLSVAARGATPVLELPHRPTITDCALPDAIGLGSAGEVTVLRFPSGTEPPSKDDPALLYRSGAAPIALAPWRSLASADHASCGEPGTGEVRALLIAPGSWIDLRLANASFSFGDLGLLAIVRWSPTRLCLEAAELTGVGEIQLADRALSTAVVARFGAKNEASRRGVDFGAEYDEPLSCRLVR